MKTLFSLLLGLSVLQAQVKEVKIGTQVWMAKNLDVATFRNGDPIPQAKTAEEWKKAGENQQPAWCYYNNDLANGQKYGKLYNWYAVNDARGLAPQGYHIPTDAEWTILIDYLGGEKVAGTKMKSNSGWISEEQYEGGIRIKTCPNCKSWNNEYRKKVACHLCKDERYIDAPLVTYSGNGTNISGFNGLPGGTRLSNGAFGNIGGGGLWWSSTQETKDNVPYRMLAALYNDKNIINWMIPGMFYGNVPEVYREITNKRVGISVRCLSGEPSLKNVETLSLEEVMSDGIKLTKGNVGKNVTDLHKLLKKMGQTIDNTEYNQRLFGSSTEKALKNLQSKLEEPETGTLNSDFYNILIQNVESQRIESQKKKEEEEKNPYREVKSYSIYENVESQKKKEEKNPYTTVKSTEEETQVSLEEQKNFLEECLNLGCFNSFIEKYGLNSSPEFKKFANNNIYVLFKGENKKYAFTYDFNIYTAPLDGLYYQPVDTKWSCAKLYCNTEQRKNWVKNLMNLNTGIYSYQPTSEKSTKIDLNDNTIQTPAQQPVGSKDIFPRKGMCFIFQTSLPQGTSESVIKDLETKLNQAGFTFKAPALSWMKFLSFSIEDLLGKTLTDDERNRFKNELSKKVYPKENSEMVTLATKSNKLFGKDCQAVFQSLYYAIQNPESNDYTKDNDGFTKLMQDKIYACRCNANSVSMKFCLKQKNRDVCKIVRRSNSLFSIRDLVKPYE